MCSAVILLPGCGGGNFANENDKLREQVLDLQSQVRELTARAKAAEGGLNAERQRQANAGTLPPLPEGVVEPRLSRIEIVSPSRGLDADRSGSDESVRLYVRTYDQKNRTIPAVATAEVTLMSAAAGHDAVTIAKHTIDAAQFDAAYRSGIAGTHYTLIVPMQQPLPAGVNTLTAKIHVTDLLTGATHEAEKLINITPAPAR